MYESIIYNPSIIISILSDVLDYISINVYLFIKSLNYSPPLLLTSFSLFILTKSSPS